MYDTNQICNKWQLFTSLQPVWSILILPYWWQQFTNSESENLEKIVNDKLLEKIFINIYEFLETEGSNLNKIIDEALLKLEESINFAKERKEEINKKSKY